MMKNIKNIIYVWVLLSANCPGKAEYTTIELVNQSPHKIVISSYDKAYDRKDKRLAKVITLISGSSVERRFDSSPSRGPAPESLLEGDSIVIEYSNLKRHVFYYPFGALQIGSYDFNILSLSNYEKQIISETESKRVFTFTNDHFEDAEFIEP